jgi:NADH dehydrogenase [ubiquinone] 1 alpha subcomplex assembly factor 5
MQENSFPSLNTIRTHFNKVAPQLKNAPFFHEEIGRRLADRIWDTKKEFKNVVEISAGPSTLRPLLAPHLTPDIYEEADIAAANLIGREGQQVDLTAPLAFDEKHYHLVISNLALTWVDDVPTALLNMGKLLKGDGLFLASMLGRESFNEFTAAFKEVGALTPHTLPLTDMQAIGSLMHKLKFALPVIDRDIITLTYPNFKTMYKELKATGCANLHPQRAKGLMGKTQWKKMEQTYTNMFQRPDGSLPLTLEVIYLTGWRPHKSQQQPLAPGSGEQRLAQALNGENS